MQEFRNEIANSEFMAIPWQSMAMYGNRWQLMAIDGNYLTTAKGYFNPVYDLR